MSPWRGWCARCSTGERIVVFGDYDVDGATSSALLLRFFRSVGGNIGVYIPDRRKEGYGPNAPALLKLKQEGAAVVVTVDCGVTAFEPLAEARRAGLDLIVIDHHQAEIALPEAIAVVDPNRIDDASPHKQLAAVGVAFLLCVGVNRALREAGWYGDARPEPDLRQWLDLVALGTVCRCRAADRRQSRAGAPGAAGDAAARQCRASPRWPTSRACDEPPGAYHLGFMLGPRVNAGGRVGQADLGARLLSSDDPHEVGALARAPRRVQCRAPRHRARGARPGDRPHRGTLRARPQGPARGAGGRERGLACRRDRHRRQPAGRALRPAGLRDRHGRRAWARARAARCAASISAPP